MNEPGEKIVLCLSGGGFRATLFHLGVVRALAEKGLIKNVTHISSASGGSILGAHLVLNWNNYCDVNRFDGPAAALLRFVQSDVRGKIFRRYPATLLLRALLWPIDRLLRVVPFSLQKALQKALEHLTTTSWLVKYYRKGLYGTRTLADLAPREEPRVPTIDILGTNLTQADVCSFSPDGFRTRPGLDADVRGDPKDIQICEAVAASSAFPGFFAPLHLRRSRIEWSIKETSDCAHTDIPEALIEDLYIADAGIYGNLGSRGLAEFREAINADWSHKIVSDAGAHVDWDITDRMQYLLPSVLRTMNIIIQLKEESERLRLEHEKDTVMIKLDAPTADKNRVDEFLRKPLSNVRTDLDRFSNTEIVCLVQDGYAKTIKSCCEAGLCDSTATLEHEWPLRLLRSGPKQRFDETTEKNKIRRAANIKWGFHRFLSDPSGMLLSLLPILIIGFIIGFPILVYTGFKEEEARFKRAAYVTGLVENPPPEVASYDYKKEAPATDPWMPPLIEDRKVYDFASWKDNPTSKVTMQRSLKFGPFDKDRRKGTAFRVETSGTEVYLACNETGATDAKANCSTQRLPHTDMAGKQVLKRRQIEFGLKDLGHTDTRIRWKWPWPQLEETYELDYRATYYDAFQDHQQHWIGSRVQTQTEKLSLLAIFPSAKAPDEGSIKCLIIARGKKDKKCSTEVETKLMKKQQKLVAYWETTEPKIGSIYKLRWTWKFLQFIQDEFQKARKTERPDAKMQEEALNNQKNRLLPMPDYHGTPTYDEFRFTKDIRVLDLRSWTEAKEGEQHVSAVRLHRKLGFAKHRDTEFLRFRIETTGNDLHIKCPQSDRTNHCQLYAEERTTDEDTRTHHVRDLVLDVSNIAPSQDVELEYEVTYFEGFQTRDQWWYEVAPETPTTTALLILFPEDRPFDVVQCREGEGGSLRGCGDFGDYRQDVNGPWAYLKTEPPEHPERQVGVRIEWEFKDLTGVSGQTREGTHTAIGNSEP